jgi:hypothetical protein
VGDFERICLESDQHLAEAAGCHQILTLVLGKPAEVPEDLREKIYRLGQPGGMPAKAAKEPVPPPLPTAANGHPAAHEAEVPDYLRAGQSLNIWPFLATIAAAFLIGAVILRAMGPFDGTHPLMRMFGGGGTVVAEGGPAMVPSPPAPPDAATNAVPTNPGPEETPRPVETPAPIETPPMPVEPTEQPVPPIERPEVPEEPVEATPKPAPTPAPPEPMPPIVAAPAEAGVVQEVGRFISDEQMLATLNPDESLWYAKPTRAVLTAGERLLVLPTYRPQVALPSGVQVTFAGESSVTLDMPTEAGASHMTADYGRFVIVTVGAAGAQIELNLAGIEGLATLVDADSVLAVKVSRWLEPGTDPEPAPGAPVVELFTTHGRVTWQQPGQPKVDIPANHVYVHVGADPPELQGPFFPPEWIDSRSVSGIDRETSVVLHDLLAAEMDVKPLNLALQERLNDRRVNVRALIARCLGNLGEFEPILKDLSDARHASYWASEADVLRQAILHGPDTAAKLHQTIQRSREKDAAVITRLIWGFSQEDLEKGGATQLVKHLKHEEMDVRVLTFLNLINITGAQEFYRPEKKPELNSAAIRNWENRRDKGTIAYKSPPTPLENYKPMPKAAGVEPAVPRATAVPKGSLEVTE